MLEVREAVAVLGDADLVEAAPRRRVEEALHPAEIIGAAFKVHMVVDFHSLIPSSQMPSKMFEVRISYFKHFRYQIFPSSKSFRKVFVTPCSVFAGARFFAASKRAGWAFSIA